MNIISNYYLVLAINTLNLMFPILGLIINTIYFFLKSNISLLEKKFIYFGIVYSLAFIGYVYFRTNETGDVFRYSLSLYYYSQSLLDGSRESFIGSIYEVFYPTWYLMLYLTSVLGQDIQFINSLAIATIYGTMFLMVFKLSQKYPSIYSTEKHIVLKILLFFSIFALLSSYRTAWAFSLVALGLFFLFNKKNYGWLYIIIGMGLHPIAIFPVLIYFLSIFIKFRIAYLFLALFLGFFAKKIIIVFSNLIEIPFLGSKIQTYMYGDWAEYRFHDNSEFMLFVLMVLLIIFLVFVVLFRLYKTNQKELDFFQSRYTNFILLYFTFILLFISFRTIETRLLLHGFILFIPLFYQIFYFRKIFLNRGINFIVLIIWFLMIDIRTFNVFNDAYIVGSGFPLNVFDSPFILVLKGVL